MKTKMNFNSLIIFASTMIISTTVSASHGGGNGRNPNPGNPAPGSNAAFVAEASEHAMRVVVGENTAAQNLVIYTNVDFDETTKSAKVLVEFRDGSKRELKCSTYMDSSHSGTVVKPEMRCSTNVNESGYWSFKPYAKTSNAGLLAESVEHALRILLATNSGLAKLVVGSDARLNEQSKNVTLTLFLTDNTQRKFNCALVDHSSHGGSVIKKELVCLAQ